MTLMGMLNALIPFSVKNSQFATGKLVCYDISTVVVIKKIVTLQSTNKFELFTQHEILGHFKSLFKKLLGVVSYNISMLV